MLPVAPHFEPQRVGAVWRVPYEERAGEAAEWARVHALKAAASDRFRLALLLVDVQNTFCLPGFELFVPGAADDNRRLWQFVFRHLPPSLPRRRGRRAPAAVYDRLRRGRRARRLALQPRRCARSGLRAAPPGAL